ncbi:MAG: hypothetical protein IJ461_00660 [Clostridia bacterium]|nr:hypothetical protein [Clostridia bacterium]
MKYIAALMVIVLLAAIGGTGYLYMTANLVVEATGLASHPASEQKVTFDDLKNRMELGALQGTAFTAEVPGSAEDYVFYTYTLRLRNDCFLDLDMIEVQIVPVEGDVLQMGDLQARGLPARSTGDISATILTRAGNHNVREIIVTYYVWGVPYTLKTTYG